MGKTAPIAILVFTIALTIVLISSFASAEEGRPGVLYGYSLNATLPDNITLIKIQAVSPSHVMGIARDNRGSYVVLLDVENPYDKPRLLQVYPLLGDVSVISTNGWPVRRIAVGTTMGEVLVFNVEGGRVYKLLDKVLGADFYVKKILILKRPTQPDGYIYAALTDESGGLSYCASCSVYIFSENEPGFARLGQVPVDVGYSISDKMISDITARVVYEGSEYYYDASALIVANIERPNLIRLDVNVTFYDYQSQQYLPASGALIDIYAYGGGRSYRFSVNADQSGVASFFVERGMIAEITAWDIVYRNYTIVINTSNVPPYLSQAGASIVLYYPPLSTPAELKTPPYMLCSLDVYDVSSAPAKIEMKGKIQNYTNPAYPSDLVVPFHAKGLSFVYLNSTREHVLAYYEPDSKYIMLWRVREMGSRLQAFKLSRDYVGNEGTLVSAFSTEVGRNLFVVLSDGRVRAYGVPTGAGDGYRLSYTYRAGSSLIESRVIIGDRYLLYAETPEGAQFMELRDYGITPLLRRDLTLNYKSIGYIDSDISSDLSSFFILREDNGILIFRNVNTRLGTEPLNLDEAIAGSLRVVVHLNPEDVEGVLVRLEHPWGTSVFTLSEDGSVVINNIIPGVNYKIFIDPRKPYIVPYETDVSFADFGDYTLHVRPGYVLYTLRLMLRDPISEKLACSVDILIDGEPVLVNNTNRVATLSVYYGNHTLTIRPSAGCEGAYEEFDSQIYVSRDDELSVDLVRRSYLISLRLVDEVGERLLGQLEVQLFDEAGGISRFTLTPDNPTTLARLHYGDYRVTVSPSEDAGTIYKTVTSELSVRGDKSVTISVPRQTYLLNVQVRDVTYGVIRGSFVVYVDNKPFSVPFSSNVSLVLPYGRYVIRVQPTEQFAKVYNPTGDITVMLTQDLSVVANLTRKTYALGVLVMEKNKPLQNVEVRFTSAEGKRLITILTTTEQGYVETNLPYGEYVIEASLKGYTTTAVTYPLEGSASLTIQLKPTITTLVIRILRFALPYVGAGVAVVLSIYGIMKLREIIRRRVESEEAPF